MHLRLRQWNHSQINGFVTHSGAISLGVVQSDCHLLLSNLCAKMPNLMIQCRRWRLAVALLLLQLNFNVRHRWVHPIINNLRFEKGEYFVLYRDLHSFEDKFFKWYRMPIKKFDYLLKMIQHQISKWNTNYREAICAEEQLIITLT